MNRKNGDNITVDKLMQQYQQGDSSNNSNKRKRDEQDPVSTTNNTSKVKNKQAANLQITAEHILREAFERQGDEVPVPKQKITSYEELQDYRLRQRKTFEDNIRKNKYIMGSWIKYAQWEESQQDFERARSIFERALDVDYKNPSVWLRYVEMEMRNKFINHARNVWDRAVSLLPRVDYLWLKYAHMEEMLGNINAARQIYERWMEWNPEPKAWKTFIRLEIRSKNYDGARAILDRFVKIHNSISSYLYYAKFETKYGSSDLARAVFERALLEVTSKDKLELEKLYVAFAKFEEEVNEIDRARFIYRYAIDNLSKQQAEELFKKFIDFEKRYGDKDAIDNVIAARRRMEYEEEVRANSHNYDSWFEYIRVEESVNDNFDRIREVYERAISNIPLIQEKRYWRRYIYLWINYALFEELSANNPERTRGVYKACLDIIPHRAFSFSKVWILFARFEIRQKSLESARKILGNAIGTHPKDKIFQEYIRLELLLGNIDRVRKIYEKYLEFDSTKVSVWKQYTELEIKIEEYERARALFDIAIQQETIDMPELMWKCYIDFETNLKNYQAARDLYEKLLKKTKHPKVWISFAEFEAHVQNTEAGRDIYQRADKYFKSLEEHRTDSPQHDEVEELANKEQRLILYESWKDFETKYGNEESITTVESKMPKKVKKQRKVVLADGTVGGVEEYYDYIFPEEIQTNKKNNLKILQMAHLWKQQQNQEQPNKQ